MSNIYLFTKDAGKYPPGAGIDLSSLIVVEGKVCWDLYIDGLVVSSDGNLLDALGAAIKVIISRNFTFAIGIAFCLAFADCSTFGGLLIVT